MKNQKNLAMLGGITVVALLAAGLSLLIGGNGNGSDDRGAFLPELKERINDVARLQITKADGVRTLSLTDGQWGLEESAGYPAEFEKVKEAIVKIAELEIEATKTKLPARHAQLGVEGIDAPESPSTQVTFWDGQGEELVSVVLGNTEYRRGGQSVYARRAGEDQVYECTGRTDLRTDVKSWADPSILRIAAARVQALTIDHGAGNVVQLARQPGEGDKFGIANVPEGRAEKYAGVANTLGGGLSTLDLDDVRKAGEVAFEGDSLVVTEFALDDGLFVVLRSVEVEDTAWFQVSARYEEPVGPPLIPDATPPADDGGEEDAGTDEDAAAAAADAAAAAAASAENAHLALSREADEINERLGPWTFAIPTYRADNLRKPMEELLAEPEVPEVSDDALFKPPVEGIGDPPVEEDADATEGGGTDGDAGGTDG